MQSNDGSQSPVVPIWKNMSVYGKESDLQFFGDAMRSRRERAEVARRIMRFRCIGCVVRVTTLLGTGACAIFGIVELSQHSHRSLGLRITAMILFGLSAVISIVPGLLAVYVTWVAFHLLRRITLSLRNGSDEELYLPSQTMLRVGFRPSRRWPWYKESYISPLENVS